MQENCSKIKDILISTFDELSVNRQGIEESQDLNAFPSIRDNTIAFIIDTNNKIFMWNSNAKDKLQSMD